MHFFTTGTCTPPKFDKYIRTSITWHYSIADDSCHYPTTSDLEEEYVLNTKGRIWVGSAQRNYGRPWQFGQFSKDRGTNRGDPVEVSQCQLKWLAFTLPLPQVTRKVSAMTNIQDDDGILVGNWSGDYSGGTPPSAWTGSGDILKQFNATKEPVQFGQCWVFSGVQTTC